MDFEENRQDPDRLLEAIRKEEEVKKNQTRGHLKIFFGYAAGVGKTYAMLEAAQAAKHQGIDVVAGYIEPHLRPETSALIDGLEVLTTLNIEYNGITLHEFDIDAALLRNPQLILVDELAHTNAEGCRHVKRYQDVEELLQAGIDVYTTLNVQHIESLNDMVASITGVRVRERIPDYIFDNADQVKLVDIEPQELLKRLKEGKIYRKAQARQATDNFFTLDNLTALREIALRRCADRINLLTESVRVKNNADYYTDEHILVCISTDPSCAKIIRTASRMANAFKGTFTALFVETPDFEDYDEQVKKNLGENMHLAEQLGAKLETVYGDDVALQIAEYARQSGVSKIVMGRSSVTKRRKNLGRPSLTERLISNAPNIDIYIIPDTKDSAKEYRKSNTKKKRKIDVSVVVSDILKCLAGIVACILIGYLFQFLGFNEANIIMVFVIGVIIISIITVHRSYSLIASLVSVLAFNFFFVDPVLTFRVNAGQGYPITFVIMFLASFITGSVAERLNDQAKQSSQTAYRTKILFDTNQLLSQAKDQEGIVFVTANQLTKLLERDIIFYLPEKQGLGEPYIFPLKDDEESKENIKRNCTTNKEKAVAEWVYRNNKRAGATTQTLPDSRCLYYAARVNDSVYGVVGIVIDKEPLANFERSILLSILGECALALENEKNAREKEQAAVFAKNEQLRANLLRSISHDLRTPLTSISGNASILLSDSEKMDEETRNQLYTDIYDDSAWLINQVEDILTVTKIEEGRLDIKMSDELIDDVITEALHHVDRKSTEHNITVNHSDEIILAHMDSKLIEEVIINIVDNAIKYTPKGSNIVIDYWKQGTKAYVRIADDGYGMSDEVKEHAFEMFYIGANKIYDSNRSFGLGLTLCKSIIDAHGGEITASDNDPHGAVFTFCLPLGKAQNYE